MAFIGDYGYFLLDFEEGFVYHCFLQKQNKVLGSYQSGQMGQTVNLLADAFGGSNPPLPTIFLPPEFARTPPLRGFVFLVLWMVDALGA